MNIRLSIIIVNYNTRELLAHCLESLFKGYRREIANHEYEVILVDNASSDDSVVMTKHNFPWVTILHNTQNDGFAKANNQGIVRSKGKYILLLNPDTLVEPIALNTLISYLDSHSQAGIVTGKIVLTSGKLDDACHRGFPTPWRAMTHFSGLSRLFPHSLFFNGYHLGYRGMDTSHEIDAGVGACLMIRRQVGEMVGWLDEDYFWYGEDLDLCFKVKQAGFQVVYIPVQVVIHYKGASSGIKKHSQHLSKADWAIKLQATKSRFDVMRIFYRKHYQDLYPGWVMTLVFWGISLKEKITHATL
jgi:GT2 family glycosyltransferase